MEERERCYYFVLFRTPHETMNEWLPSALSLNKLLINISEQCLNQYEVYDICNAACEPSCVDPEPICAKICTGGCICSSGLLRNDNGVCVSVEKCPESNSTDPGLLAQYMNVIKQVLHLSGMPSHA
jgi:hypothetical protein